MIIFCFICFLSVSLCSLTVPSFGHTHTNTHRPFPIISLLYILLSSFNFLLVILFSQEVSLSDHSTVTIWPYFRLFLCVSVSGGPGSGKALQCERMEERFGLRRVTLGDLLCSELQSNNDRGRYLRDALERGEQLPEVSVAVQSETSK